MNARRWHRPRIWAIALTLLGMALFGRLAIWQFDQAEAKRALFAAFAGAANQAPIALDAARRLPVELQARHPRVHVRGTFEPDRRYLLDNQVQDGRVGVHVIDVFVPQDGSPALLVDEGFVARANDRRLPAIPSPASTPVEIDGLYTPPPGAGLRLGDTALSQRRDWPKTVLRIDPAEIGADLGRTLDARMVRLLPEPGSAFVREWTPGVFPPERHLAYAWAWLGFLATTLVLFVGLHWRRGISE